MSEGDPLRHRLAVNRDTLRSSDVVLPLADALCVEFEDELELFDTPGIFHRDQAHPFYRSNPYIISGYRQNFSCTQALRSACSLHNEIGNIWTHALPCAWFGYLLWHHASLWFSLTSLAAESPHHAESEYGYSIALVSRAAAHRNIAMYCIGAVTVFALSTIFHLFSCISVYACAVLVRLDYAGILVQIMGSSISCFYFCFYCQPDTLLLHTVACVISNMIGFVVTLHSEFQSPRYNTFRAAVFSGAAMYGIFPMIQVGMRDGADEFFNHFAGYVWQLLAYGVGVVLYALHIPERWSPGSFDLHIHSHSLMHICVFIAAQMHYNTLMDNLEYRMKVGCAPEGFSDLA